MPFEIFDRYRLKLLPLGERIHDLDRSVMKSAVADNGYRHPTIDLLAERIRAAKAQGANVTLMLGGHVIRSGSMLNTLPTLTAPWMGTVVEKGSPGFARQRWP